MNNIYEKKGLLNRIKESGSLFIFIFFALIASLIIMNLLIFPIAIFSIKYKTAFTFIVKYLFWIFVIASAIYLLIKRIIFYKKNELSNVQIIKNIFVRPFSFVLFLFLILLSIFLLIAFINFILQKNYYLLYKIINF